MKNISLISLVFLAQIAIGISFFKCKNKTDEAELNRFERKNNHCNALKNVARIYESAEKEIHLCLEGRPFDLEIALKNGSSDFLDITKAECKGLNCSLEAEYKTSAPAPLKMKIFGEILDNGYIEIEIDGKKDKYELVD